jgi:hypothetical protein
MPTFSNTTSLPTNNDNGLPPLTSTKPLSLLSAAGLPAWGPYSPACLLRHGSKRLPLFFVRAVARDNPGNPRNSIRHYISCFLGFPGVISGFLGYSRVFPGPMQSLQVPPPFFSHCSWLHSLCFNRSFADICRHFILERSDHSLFDSPPGAPEKSIKRSKLVELKTAPCLAASNPCLRSMNTEQNGTPPDAPFYGYAPFPI